MSVLSANKLRHLPLSFLMQDDIFPGFELGDFAVLRGNAASLMAFALSVRTQLSPAQGSLGSSIIFVDGNNMFSPYLVAEIARDYSLDPKITLENIYVSRAFTAYQLSSLIMEKLDPALKRNRAGLLIFSDITSLFMDRDIPWIEAKELFVKICTKLSEIAERKQAVIAVNYFSERHSRRSLFFEAVLFGKCNILIRVEKTNEVLTLALEEHPRLNTFNREFLVDNISLASFMKA